MIGFVLHNSMQRHAKQSLVLQGTSASGNTNHTISPQSAHELKFIPELAAGSNDDTVLAITHKQAAYPQECYDKLEARQEWCLQLKCYLPSTGPTKIRQSVQSSTVTAAEVSKRQMLHPCSQQQHGTVF